MKAQSGTNPIGRPQAPDEGRALRAVQRGPWGVATESPAGRQAPDVEGALRAVHVSVVGGASP
jgi:hypothetical protein